MLKKILLSSLYLNIGLLLGRLTGFVREAFVAANYGVSEKADIVVLMLTVPDLLVAILMGGAMGAALVPEFSQRPDRAKALLYQAVLLFGSFFMVVAALLYWQQGVLVSLLAPGFQAETGSNAATAVGWVIWLIPMTVLAGVTTAYLHSKNYFAVASFGTLIINSTIIVGLISIGIFDGTLFLLACFILLGGSIRLCSQLLAIKISWCPIKSISPVLIHKELMKRYFQAMLSGSFLLLLPVLARALASYESSGSVAAFNYSMRLVEFPLAIAVTFLAVVLFPRLSETYINNDELHRKLIKLGMRITLLLAVVATLSLGLLTAEYTELVYGYGNMLDNDLSVIQQLTFIGMLSVPLQGVSVLMTAICNSRKNTLMPMVINAIGVVCFLIFGFFNIFGQGLAGLMWGIFSAHCVIFLLFILLLKIDKLVWQVVFLEREFLGGMMCSAGVLLLCVFAIQALDVSAFFTLFISMLAALLSLSLMIFLNRDFRFELTNQIRGKL